MDLPAPLNRTVSDSGSGWRLIAADAVTEATERRDRVLAHTDIAIRLTERPLDYKTPEQWNGYLPPAIYDGQINTSPCRAALIDILHAVDAAEQESS